MTPAKGGIWARGYRDYCPRRGRGRSVGGAGGVGERGGGSIRVRLPGLAPLQGSRHDISRSCAGPWGRASMVFVDGEGVPSPAPPRVISPRSGVGGDAGEEQDRGQGISRLLPPLGTGEGRMLGAGQVGERGERYSGSPSQACAPPGPSPRHAPLRGGSPGEGAVWFLSTGRGFPPRPLPG